MSAAGTYSSRSGRLLSTAPSAIRRMPRSLVLAEPHAATFRRRPVLRPTPPERPAPPAAVLADGLHPSSEPQPNG
jgi:hypothetical protein